MLDWLHKYGLPQNLSIQGEYIDNANVLMHWLMLFLFIGWGIFFIVSLYKFSASRNKKANYTGVKSHLSSVFEGGIAIIEIIALFGFSYPVWTYRVNEVPDSRDAVNIRVIAQQFAWNIHYPGEDGVFGRTDINLVDEAEGNFIGIDRSDPFAKDDIIPPQNQMHIPVNKKIRVGGLVKNNSVKKNETSINFIITDLKKEIIVSYTGLIPNLFSEGKGVIAEGILNDKKYLLADKILAKHDENYMPPEGIDALEKANN